MNFWNKITAVLGELFFPEADRCPVCGKEGGFCDRCKSELSTMLAGGNAAFFYGGIVRDIIHRLKFKDQPYLAKTIARLITEHLDFEGQVITAVPLHRKRRRQRGYNQSELIAREISRIKEVPYEELLLRVRNTPPQSLIKSGAERKENIRNAFDIRNNNLTDMRIILIDDVITTGATMEECRKMLIKAGAAEVNCITFAKGKDHGNSKNTAQESVGKR